MSETFDPYHKWLGIPPEEQPPNHYRLLGIKLFEGDEDVIATAADARMMHLKSFQAGRHSAFSQRLLNEIASAKVCLLSPGKRAAYDAALQARMPPDVAVPVASVPTAVQAPPHRPVAAPAPSIPEVSISRRLARRRRRGWPWGIVLAGAGILILLAAALFLNREGDDAVVAQSEAPTFPLQTSQRSREKREKSVTGVKPSNHASDSVPSEATSPGSPPPPELLRSDRLLGDLLPAGGLDPSEPEKDLLPEPSSDADPESPPGEEPESGEEKTLPKETQEGNSQSDGKLSVPSENEQKAVKARIHALFRDELIAAREPQQKSDLASKMFLQGAKTKDDPVLRFVFIDWAGSLAAEAGDLEKTLASVDFLGQQYRVAVLPRKADKLSETVNALRGDARFADIQVPLIDTTTRLAETAVEKDDFDTATRLMKLAQRVARATRTASLIRQTTTRLRDFERLAVRYRAAEQSLEILEKDPTSGDANLTAGQWYCFGKGNWARGLPYLAKASDASLAELARRDLRNPTDPMEQAALADAWWDRVDKEDLLVQGTVRMRAKHWYAMAASKASGLDKVRLQKRLREIAEIGKDADAPTTLRDRKTGALQVGEWVDLSELIESEDARGEKSERNQNITMVLTPVKPGTRISRRLPVKVEGSYELHFNCHILGQKPGSVQLLLPVGTARCSAYFGFYGHTAGIGHIDGKSVLENPSKRRAVLQSGGAYSIFIRVQTDNQHATITAALNEVPLFRWAGKQQSLSLGNVVMRNPDQPEIGNWTSRVAYSHIRFRLLSGKATLTGISP